MPRISQRKVTRLLRICENGATNDARGTALEDLICYLFGSVPGMSVNARDHVDYSRSQEIDIALWNDGVSFLPRVVLIECKNWASQIGSPEVREFESKLRERGHLFGILVAMNGVTGDPAQLTSAHDVIAGALRDGRNIVVFTKIDITSIVSPNDIIELIKKKLCQLAVHRTCLV
jgi:hypothetical protein